MVCDTLVISTSSECTDILFLPMEPSDAGSWRPPYCNEDWPNWELLGWDMGIEFVVGGLCCDLRVGLILGASWCNPWVGICWDVEECTSCNFGYKFKLGMAPSSKSASIDILPLLIKFPSVLEVVCL